MSSKLKISGVSCLGVILLVWFDQWTKQLAELHLKNGKPLVLINGVFELSYLENHGAAFGMLQNQRIFFLILTVVILACMVYIWFKMPFTRRYRVLRVLSVFFVSGAIGNVIDRYLNGYVIDFFYISLINFPVFNVADIYVTWTVAVFLILFLFYYKEEDFAFLEKKKEQDS